MADQKSSTRQVRLLVHGKVQGVFFRVTVRKWALELGLTGYVKNQPDGSVGIIAQGSASALEELEQRCYHGVRAAHVTDVVTTELTSPETFDSFEIRYD